MFSVHCPRHGQEVLLGHRQILAIDGSGDDLAVHWVCWCGHRGVQRTAHHHAYNRAPELTEVA